MKIIQITDTHLFKEDKSELFGVKCNAAFDCVIEKIKSDEINETDVIFLTGDISQDYSVESYQKAADVLSSLNKPIYWIPGNHDNIEIAESVFNQYALFKRVSHFSNAHWHFIFLNTKMGDIASGNLSESELNMLKNELNQASKDKKIALVMHHHPFPTQTPLIDQYILQNTDALLKVICNYDIALIICGHVHNDYQIKHDKITLETSPATCLQFKKGSSEIEKKSGYKVYFFEKKNYYAIAKFLNG